jgi:hypothetical protein
VIIGTEGMVMALDVAYREGYRAGFNGYGMLSGVDCYDDPWCKEWRRGYRDGMLAYLAK